MDWSVVRITTAVVIAFVTLIAVGFVVLDGNKAPAVKPIAQTPLQAPFNGSKCGGTVCHIDQPPVRPTSKP